MSAISSHPDRRPLRMDMALLAVALICGVALSYYLRRFYHDDAFIALRYAENLRDGLGPVWNAGERVEGYTSPLWVLLCAGLSTLGLDLVPASRLLGVLSLLALILVLIRFERRLGALTALLMGTNGSAIAWSLGGLETMGFTLLISWGLLWADSLRPDSRPGGFLGAGAVLGLAQLCRPEAVLFLAVSGGSLLIQRIRTGKPAARSILGFFLPMVVTVLAHTSWRLSYYGEWLPNTFHVKEGLAVPLALDGLSYVARFAAYQLPLMALLGYSLLWARHWDPPALPTLISALLYAGYIVSLGGDHMQWYRFLVPLLPMLYFLGVRGMFSGSGSGRLRWAPQVMVGILALYNLGGTVLLGEGGWKQKDPAAYHGTLAGKYMRDHWPPESLVALNTAGSAAFYSKLRSIDMLGLNDKHIARQPSRPDPSLPWTQVAGHQKGAGQYVLGREPDFIIIGGSEGYTFPWFVSDREIMASPRFWAEYELEERLLPPRDGMSGFVFRYYRRKLDSRQPPHGVDHE